MYWLVVSGGDKVRLFRGGLRFGRWWTGLIKVHPERRLQSNIEAWRERDDAQSLADGILGGGYWIFLELHLSSSSSVEYSINILPMPTADRAKKILSLGYDFRP